MQAPKSRGIRTIFFDLDGTIIDTEPVAARVAVEAFREWGVKLEAEDAGYVTGRTWENAFDYLFKKYRVPVPRKQAAEEILLRYKKGLEASLPRVPGGVEAVRSLCGKYPLALITGSNRREVELVLATLGIRDCFQAILCSEDYPRSKPAPDGYRKALELLGADPGSTLVFEDSEAGIESARAAGLWVVAITSTNHFGHDHSDAHERIPDLSRVTPEWVAALSARLTGSRA